MLKNYFTTSVRSLTKNKLFSLLNILGLSVGITCSLCIYLFVQHELSYDGYHSDASRIYRVIQLGENIEHSSSLPFPTGPTLQDEFSNFIEKTTRLFNFQASTLSVVYEDESSERKVFNEPRFFFADSTFFELFDFKFVEGNSEHVLDGPNLVVITRSTARRYFGERNAVGKALKFEGRIDLVVTGVVEDVPDNSHFKFDFIASFTSLPPLFPEGILPTGWYWNPVWTYVKLRASEDRNRIEKLLPAFSKKYYHPSLADKAVLTLEPLTDIYLHSHTDYEIGAMSDVRYIYIFSILGAAILFVACINFINLTTAKSAERFKEIGVRKSIGALRGQLISQFMIESVVITVLAGLLAIVCVTLLLPTLNNLTDKNFVPFDLFNQTFWLAFALIVVVVAACSGCYPAFVMSGQKTTQIMKPNSGALTGGAWLRKVLVIFQFTVSATIISGSIIAYQQIQFMKNSKLGFDGDQVVILPVQRTSLVPKYESFKDRLLENPNIRSVTVSHAVVGRETQTSNYKPEGDDDLAMYPVLIVKNDFLKTMGIRVLAGKDFEEDLTSPGFKAIINKSMSEKFGWKNPEDAIGRVIDGTLEGKITIIGVSEDFNYVPLRQSIGPLIMTRAEGPFADFFTNFVIIRVQKDNLTTTIAFIRDEWESIVTESSFDYFFLDDAIDKIYKGEEKFNMVTTTFSFFAIVIGAMGLFGLATFLVRKRKKEISIRKVLGASTPSLFGLLSGNFLQLIAISGLISIPLSWLLMDRWLQGFAYRIGVGYEAFIISVLTILVVGAITICYNVYRAAITNPIESLRSE
jgi:putative ABC transport system permease protein